MSERIEIREGHLFKYPVKVILLDGPLAGEHINQPTHIHSEELIVYQPRPLNFKRGELTCIPFQDVVRPHYRYKFKDFTLDMREALYEYSGEL
jgi:hypothetical protein